MPEIVYAADLGGEWAVGGEDEHGQRVVYVLEGLTEAQQRWAIAQVLRQDGRRLAALTLPAAMAMAAAGKALAQVSPRALTATTAAAGAAVVAGTVWVSMPGVSFHHPAVAIPGARAHGRPGVQPAPQVPSRGAGGPHGNGAAGRPGSGTPSPRAPSPAPPPSSPPSSPGASPSASASPSPSPSLLPSLLPSPAGSPAPLVSHHKHKVCVTLSILGVCLDAKVSL